MTGTNDHPVTSQRIAPSGVSYSSRLPSFPARQNTPRQQWLDRSVRVNGASDPNQPSQLASDPLAPPALG